MEDEGVPGSGVVHEALHLPAHVGSRGPGVLAGLVVREQDDVLQAAAQLRSE